MITSLSPFLVELWFLMKRFKKYYLILAYIFIIVKYFKRVCYTTVLNTFTYIVMFGPCDNHFNTLPGRELHLTK